MKVRRNAGGRGEKRELRSIDIVQKCSISKGLCLRIDLDEAFELSVALDDETTSASQPSYKGCEYKAQEL